METSDEGDPTYVRLTNLQGLVVLPSPGVSARWVVSKVLVNC